MTDAVNLSDLKYPDLHGDGSRRSETRRRNGGPGQTRAVRAQASASSPREAESPLAPDSLSGIARQSQQPGELDRLYRSLAEVTPENHPRTARLLASSTRKTAQKVIEEAGEVALEAVKHHTRGISANQAEPLGKRPFDDIDPIHEALAFRDAAPKNAVKTDGMHLIEIGQCIKSIGEIANARQRRYVAVHRIQRFECDDLGAVRRGLP